MIITRSYDEAAIKQAVMSMINDVIEDGTAVDCFELDVNQDCWLDLEGCGYMHVSAYNRTTLDIHPYILKESRYKSLECGKASLKWVADNAPDMYKKIISQVPSIYPHIKKYTERLGFKHEGTNTHSFTKNGQLYDLWLFGIERKYL
jgi:hypothetical protein